MADIYGQLIKSQLENLGSDPGGTPPTGLIWINTGTSVAKFYDGSAIRTVADTASTQTFTNKTLSGNTATNLISGSGTLTLNTSGTATVPNATDTLVGKATTDTLTNKTLTSAAVATSLVFNGTTSGTMTFIPGAAITNFSVTWPIAQGAANTTISNNGSGVLTWVSIFSNPATTTGDTIYASSGSTLSRLAIGSTGDVYQVVAGVPAWSSTFATDKTFTGVILASNGTNSAPSYTFNGDPDTGIYHVAANKLGFTTAGVASGQIDQQVWSIGTNTITALNADHLCSGRWNILTPSATGRMSWNTDATSGTTNEYIRFSDASGTNQAGNITINAVAHTVTYGVTSDIRLKTNMQNFNATALVTAMNPVQYERLSDPGTLEYGFIAQELVKVFPQAVSRGDLMVRREGEPEPFWNVDYGKLTGVLAKALQEVFARLAMLEAK